MLLREKYTRNVSRTTLATLSTKIESVGNVTLATNYKQIVQHNKYLTI